MKGLELKHRRLIACCVIVLFLSLYIWAVSSLAHFVPNDQIARLIYFALAGMLWGLPLLPVISWSEDFKKKRK